MKTAIDRVKSEGAGASLSVGEAVQTLRVQLSNSIETHSADYDDYARQLRSPVPHIRCVIIDKMDKLSNYAFQAEGKARTAGLEKGLGPAERSSEPEQTQEDDVRERVRLKDTYRPGPEIDRSLIIMVKDCP